jgi:predicted CXXCH cytochrome family protein
MRYTLLALALVLAGCSPGKGSVSAPAPHQPDRVTSNLFRRDYAGSEACRACHSEIYAAWQGSPMRNMTRPIDGARVLARFDGTSYQLHRDRARFESEGEARFMRIASPGLGGAEERLYRITKVIGGRYREDFVGVDVTGAARPARDRGRGPEQVLPVSFVYGTGAPPGSPRTHAPLVRGSLITGGSWRYKGYSVLLPERPGLRVGPIWARTCIGCHNTLPQLAMLYDELLGPGAPSYQGSISDKLLPEARRWRPVVSDSDRLRAELSEEVAYLTGVSPSARSELADLLRFAVEATRQRLDAETLIEVGIGCEACHGGSREHVDNPDLLPSLAPRSSAVSVVSWNGRPPDRAAQVNRTCARCHTVLFSRYSYTWEGGKRRDPLPGGSSINSGEARDFLLGACSSKLTCVHCHDPHGADDRSRLDALGTVAGNPLCLECHPALAGPDALAAHTHHPADSEGSACLACHMPRKNMGLDYQLSRYHRIGSPTDRERVERDRPLECALCHPDASAGELVEHMERWWGARYDQTALAGLYGGDLSVRALEYTLQAGLPHERGAAIGALGDRRVARALPELVRQLAHPIPLVRYYARRAIENITGEPVAIELDGSAVEIARAAGRWWRARRDQRGTR